MVEQGLHRVQVSGWADPRRKTKIGGDCLAVSTQALAYIRLLYDVEDAAKEQFQQQDATAPQRPLVTQRNPPWRRAVCLAGRLAVIRAPSAIAGLPQGLAFPGGARSPGKPSLALRPLILIGRQDSAVDPLTDPTP